MIIKIRISRKSEIRIFYFSASDGLQYFSKIRKTQFRIFDYFGERSDFDLTDFCIEAKITKGCGDFTAKRFVRTMCVQNLSLRPPNGGPILRVSTITFYSEFTAIRIYETEMI